MPGLFGDVRTRFRLMSGADPVTISRCVLQHASGRAGSRPMRARARSTLPTGRVACVAGPPAVGKSTLMQRMREGAADVLPAAIGDVAGCQFLSLKGSRDLGSRLDGRMPDLVVHVDLSMFATM